MQSKPLNAWDDFEEKIRELESRCQDWLRRPEQRVPPLLYRGQRDSLWQPKTTLERCVKDRELSVAEYYRIIHDEKEKIKQVTENCCYIPTLEDHHKWLESQGGNITEEPPEYLCMKSLRHNRFPSPLLDWTTSSYVAAFFAFNESSPKTKHVSIYVLQNWVVGYNTINTWTPNIYCLEGTPSTEYRDRVQESRYTICTFQKDDELLYYVPHDWITDQKRYPQDMLLKFDLPSSEKSNVLGMLDPLGINYQILFGTEEASDEDTRLKDFFASLADKYFPDC